MSRGLRIALIEPFLGGSHAAWARGYAAKSNHQVTIIGQSGAHWKWRMHGGAITCARAANALDHRPDVFLCSDMVDAAVFRSLLRPEWRSVPLAVYFHENQLTYPWKEGTGDKAHDRHYAFINYTSALSADAIFFNSNYHRNVFLEALPGFLKAFPDDRNEHTIAEIAEKSTVLPIGMDLQRFDSFIGQNAEPPKPMVLWNHRHEHDKNPEAFFQLLFRLDAAGVEFSLAVAGESFADSPPIFDVAKEKLSHRITHWGYCSSFDDYARLLCARPVLPVTSMQEFFGIAVAEAIHCGARAILPQRLSYPGLFGEDADFYTTAEALFEKTKQALTVPQLQATRQMSRYDWTEMAPVYDRAMSGLIKI